MIKLKYLLLLFLGIVVVSANRVLLRDITSITLRRGDYTTGRRASPVPQLQCVGGTAQGKFIPKTVQCYNRGFDGLSVQWECQAELPKEYQFGRISVSCEGYEYPDDPYVLAGSCGLKYELDYSTAGARAGARKAAYSSPEYETNYTYIFYFIVIAFVLYLLYTSMTSTRDGNEGDRFRAGGPHFPGGGGPGSNQGPYPPGWRPPTAPPSYDETFKNTGTSGANPNPTSSSGPGFFSGLGLGALGGYFMGNNGWGSGSTWGNGWGRSGNAYRRRGPSQYERDSGFYSDDRAGPSHSYNDYGASSPTSSTHTTSGFGGTERR